MQAKEARLKPRAVEPSKVGRPAVLSPAIAGRLRTPIIAGAWAPGARLPTRRDLCGEFGCSTITLQMAMDTLAEEGFIRSDGRHGTFVHDRPPHLTDIAVVYPHITGRNHFWEAMDETVKAWRSKEFKLSSWYGVDTHEDNPTYSALRARVSQGSLAGIVFVCSPHFFLKSPLLLKAGIPRVAFASNWRHPGEPVSTISFSQESFSERAVRRLAREGCRRIAVLTFPSDSYGHWEGVCRKHGLDLRPYWFQCIHQGTAETGRNVARLLFREGQSDQPDAVVIADDNLVEAVTQGMVDAGVGVPRDVRVVAHCNFPWPTRSALPVTRLGWDTRGILALALGLIEQSRANTTPTRAWVEAVFDDELDGASMDPPVHRQEGRKSR